MRLSGQPAHVSTTNGEVTSTRNLEEGTSCNGREAVRKLASLLDIVVSTYPEQIQEIVELLNI